jgi:hypothetical protein
MALEKTAAARSNGQHGYSSTVHARQRKGDLLIFSIFYGLGVFFRRTVLVPCPIQPHPPCAAG